MPRSRSTAVVLAAALLTGAVGYLIMDANGNGLDGEDWVCSGALVAPTVFLTAGHCVEGTNPAARVYVSFRAGMRPMELTAMIRGTGFAAHPEYRFPAHDVGVVTLPPGAAAGITPLRIASQGHLDREAARGGIGRMTAINVGYGTTSEIGRGRPWISWTPERQYSESKVLWLNATTIGIATNASNAGRGGTCFGDSGSPVYLASDPTLIVGVTSWTLTAHCQAQGGYWRADIASTRAFLANYLTLP